MPSEYSQDYCEFCETNVLVVRQGTNHTLHILLSLFTFGIWLFIWAAAAINKRDWRCAQCGQLFKTPNTILIKTILTLLVLSPLILGIYATVTFFEAISGNFTEPTPTPPAKLEIEQPKPPPRKIPARKPEPTEDPSIKLQKQITKLKECGFLTSITPNSNKATIDLLAWYKLTQPEKHKTATILANYCKDAGSTGTLTLIDSESGNTIYSLEID